MPVPFWPPVLPSFRYLYHYLSLLFISLITFLINNLWLYELPFGFLGLISCLSVYIFLLWVLCHYVIMLYPHFINNVIIYLFDYRIFTLQIIYFLALYYIIFTTSLYIILICSCKHYIYWDCYYYSQSIYYLRLMLYLLYFMNILILLYENFCSYGYMTIDNHLLSFIFLH